jgi:SAM-dependent methyltransferase
MDTPAPAPTPYDFAADSRLAPFLTAATAALSARLEHERPLSRPHFDAAWQARFAELGPGVPEDELREYGRFHARRCWEMVNALAILLPERPQPRVLDIGLSVFTALFTRLFPHLELITLGPPAQGDLLAFYSRASAAAGARSHVGVDLSWPRFLTPEVAARLGTFDVIVFTEVLEHLPVHPTHVLGQLVELLAPTGQVYLTTPNFFSRVHLQQVASRINPQAVFPKAGNAAGAHHYREFDMLELLQFIADAGGMPTGWCFSDCWDEAPVVPADQRSNLVVTFGRRGG